MLASKSELVAKAALIAAKHPLQVPRPPHWGGYIVLPERIEFGRAGQVVCTIAFVIALLKESGIKKGYRHKAAEIKMVGFPTILLICLN
ncbi:pyridoxamine 5'-phosphate oxidase [Actinobacillus equuli]|nr:pyridoxamine 5'-phosphate oxidase [Actinobacillus equuli]